MTSIGSTTKKILPVGLLAVLALTACGDEGSSGTTDPEDVEGAGCEPVAGDTLVALEDDQQLQNAENIVAVGNADAIDATAIEALDRAAAELTQDRLINLNKAVDVDRDTPAQAAESFVSETGVTEGLTQGEGDITVGYANFSENETLGNIYKLVLEAAGYDVEITDTGNREFYEPALESGEIHVVPEYLSTMTEFLNRKLNGGDEAEPVASADVDATLGELTALAEQSGLVVGTPAEAQDTNAFAVTTAFVDQHGITTLSQFAEQCSGSATILGGPPECPERPFCQIGLEEVYGIQVGQFEPLDIGTLSKTALANGTVTISTVLSTDSALAEGVTVEGE